MIGDNRELPQIPKNWCWSTLLDCTKKVTDGSHYTPKYVSEGYPFITISQIEDDKIDFSSAKLIGENDYQKLKGNCNPLKNDVLFSKDGTVGKVIEIDFDNKFIVLSSLAIIRPYTQLTRSSYLKHILKSKLILDQATELKTGTALTRIILRNLKTVNIPIPPLPEQHRIVAKIEELFTRLDAGVSALRQVQAQLKQYRQAVLKAAVEGRLTAQWREEHKGELEPASELLQRILKERREKWESEQLAKYEAKGQPPPKDWREKYKEPVQPDTANLPELPEGWVWCSFEQIAQHKPNAIKAGPFGSALKKEFYIEKGHKIYGQEQVIRNDPSYGDYYIDEKRFQALRSCEVAPGDILISLVGTIGKILILPDEIEPGIINPRLVKLSLDRRAMAQVYIRTYLESPASKAFFQIVSHGGTMDILNLTILKQLPVPLPPLVEQIEIVNAIDAIETNIAYMTATSNMELSRMSLLRQSILRRAFEGKLVPQDPEDESASVLLERIRAEKAKREATKRQRKRQGQQNTAQLDLGEYRVV